ncbi:MAG: LytR C-terminal domain-containing protein [Acidimicrobiales bacterium]
MDRPDPESSGGGQGGRHLALGRATAVIVVAVVLGVLILRTGGPASLASSTSTSSTSTTAGPTSTTSTTLAPHASVKVLVANDSTTDGVAAGYTTLLQKAGWSVLVPTNAKSPPRATSSVYYAANMRSDADTLAVSLGLALSTVVPLSPATPVSNTAGADVVLLVGADLAAKTPPSTVPPSTSTTAVKSTSTTKGHKS